MTKLAA